MADKKSKTTCAIEIQGEEGAKPLAPPPTANTIGVTWACGVAVDSL